MPPSDARQIILATSVGLAAAFLNTHCRPNGHALLQAVLLRRSLRESGRLVPVATEVATVDNLRSLLTRGAFSCLHFSGHGHPDALAFEDPQGAAHFISLQHLQRLICAGDSSSHVQLVFVNCCYSGVAAQHFVDAGIPHVVCSPERLRDAAAAAFTRGLYMALAVGKTVAQPLG